MIDLTPIANAVIALVAALITAFLIPWIKAKIDAEKLNKVAEWVNIAVQAAEQIYNGSGRGAEKKAYVLEFLRSKGYTLDMESVENLIEAAVFALPKQLESVIDSTE